MHREQFTRLESKPTLATLQRHQLIRVVQNVLLKLALIIVDCFRRPAKELLNNSAEKSHGEMFLSFERLSTDGAQMLKPQMMFDEVLTEGGRVTARHSTLGAETHWLAHFEV